MENLLSCKHNNFYKNFNSLDVIEKDDNVFVGNENIMNTNQHDIMREYAKVVTSYNRGRILEIGYGAGIFANELQKFSIKEHVIVECHPKICKNAINWAKNENSIFVINDLWQNVVEEIGQFDGVFYDVSCPPGEAVNDLLKFITICFKKLLKYGGVFTFWYCSKTIEDSIYNALKKHSSSLDIFIHSIDKPQNWPFNCTSFIIFKACK